MRWQWGSMALEQAKVNKMLARVMKLDKKVLTTGTRWWHQQCDDRDGHQQCNNRDWCPRSVVGWQCDSCRVGILSVVVAPLTRSVLLSKPIQVFMFWSSTEANHAFSHFCYCLFALKNAGPASCLNVLDYTANLDKTRAITHLFIGWHFNSSFWWVIIWCLWKIGIYNLLMLLLLSLVPLLSFLPSEQFTPKSFWPYLWAGQSPQHCPHSKQFIGSIVGSVVGSNT